MFSFCWVVCQEVPWWPLGPSDESQTRSGTDELGVTVRSHLTPLSFLCLKDRLSHSLQGWWENPGFGI